MTKIDFRKLAVKAAKIAIDKKAVDTVILDVQEMTALANYFVITTAESSPQINAVCGEIEKEFKEEGVRPLRREGVASPSWRVIDYGGIVVHVMSPYIRETYKLEKLWDGAKILKADTPAILKIKEPQKLKELVKKAGKTVKLKKAKLEQETKKAAKKAGKKVEAAKKTIEKGLKKAEEKVKKAKKTVKAVGKGIEAFGETLIKKSAKKKAKK